MMNLPHELALDIFSRLPISSIMQMKCVCRAWYAIAKDPRLSCMYDARSNKRNPCLILQSNSSNHKNLYFVSDDDDRDLVYNRKARRVHEQQLKLVENGFLVEGSCNGLVCVCDVEYFDPKYIFNPFTRDCIELPRANQYPDQQISFGLGYDSTTREYKVVRVAQYNAQLVSSSVGWSDVQILTLGSNVWTSIGRCPCLLDYGSSEAFVNKSFHWSVRRYHNLRTWVWIISFELGTEEFKEIHPPGCENPYFDFSLFVVDGCLAVGVYFDDGRVEVWKMKEYNVKESWSKHIVIPSYFSVTPNRNLHIWVGSRVKKGPTQVLCTLKNGEILLKYNNKDFVLYDPQREHFRDIGIEGLPEGYFLTTFLSVSFSPFQMIGKVDDKGNGDEQWRPKAEEAFISLMVEECQSKTMQTCTFSDETWEMFDDELFKRFKRRYTVPKLKSKFIGLRQKYRAFAELLKHTKFRWNPHTNKGIANKDFWNKYTKMHPNGKGVKRKLGYKYYNLLSIIFDNSTPVGDLSRTFRGPLPIRHDCWCSSQA